MINVLIVEDEPIANDAYAAYVGRVPGFAVAAQVRTGADALRVLGSNRIDLVLLDVHLPDMLGTDVARAMRARGHGADVIVLTSARDLAVVRAAVTYGILHYLVKPFAFPTLRDRLEHYRAYHGELSADRPPLAQHEVDRLLGTSRASQPAAPPKGLSRESLDAVTAAIEALPAGAGLSAGEAAELLGASRVTARRYLEYLVDIAVAARHIRYGGAHRPRVEYRRAAVAGRGTDPASHREPSA